MPAITKVYVISRHQLTVYSNYESDCLELFFVVFASFTAMSFTID